MLKETQQKEGRREESDECRLEIGKTVPQLAGRADRKAERQETTKGGHPCHGDLDKGTAAEESSRGRSAEASPGE